MISACAALRGWSASSISGGHGSSRAPRPEQARVALAFAIPNVGHPPVRLHVAVEPAQRPDGAPVLFMTLTARGAPVGQSVKDALKFLDEVHDHVTQSFLELTPETMHTSWGLRQ